MVREARFAWDRNQPMPTELTARDWDSDLPDERDQQRLHRRRASSPRQEKKSSPDQLPPS